MRQPFANTEKLVVVKVKDSKDKYRSDPFDFEGTIQEMKEFLKKGDIVTYSFYNNQNLAVQRPAKIIDIYKLNPTDTYKDSYADVEVYDETMSRVTKIRKGIPIPELKDYANLSPQPPKSSEKTEQILVVVLKYFQKKMAG